MKNSLFFRLVSQVRSFLVVINRHLILRMLVSKEGNLDRQDLSDEELMELYQSSDYLAFETLYKRHSGRILQYLTKKVGTEIGQELLQDTFARIHKSRDKYNTQFPFLPWIF